MTDWNPRANELFLSAIDLPGEERRRFLDAQCGDDAELRRQVESLLAAGEKVGDFLVGAAVETQKPAPGPTVDYRPIGEGPGTLIGPYKLLQKIGEGGMGAVYMAEQEKPVRRMVALKIIKPGMDTAQVVARFESERQALAMMDHPNIAKVLDAGATASGRPYFVMELVKGVPITEFCDRNHTPAHERLRLFVGVCHAIQHAHLKGVIHRDIKPSNVMVTLHDGVPVVKVIDFGVAKATAQRLTEKTLFTAYGQMIGTPAYMSPEQAEMSGLDIDTRSDVYSLGVLLYELLTGTTPLEARKLRQAAYAEIQRMIREDEPQRPSTRISSLGDTATIMAGNRGLDVKKLVQLLSGDLDWIVMKALEKDRNRRYTTPDNFAADIERCLRNEAVEARPPSPTYKFRKFVKRNRGLVAAGAMVAAALILGAAVSTWQAVRATRAEVAARKERDRAEASFRQARAAVDDYFTQVSESKLLKVPSLQPLRKELLNRAQKYYETFIKERGEDPSVKAELAGTFYRMGWICSIVGPREKALDSFQKAAALYDELARLHPDNERFQVDRAIVWNDLGTTLAARGQSEKALETQRRALEVRQVLAQKHPTRGRFQNELAKSHTNVANLLSDAGKIDEALGAYQSALQLNERWAGARPEDLADFPSDLGRNFNTPQAIRLDLAIDHKLIAYVHYRSGRTAEALRSLMQARDILEALIRDDPRDLEYRSNLGGVLNFLAFIAGLEDRQQEAHDALQRALAIAEALANENPAVTNFRDHLALAQRDLGRWMRRNGQPVEARALLERSVAVQEALLQDEPDVDAYRHALASIYRELGWVHRAQGQAEEALRRFQQARVLNEKMAAESLAARYDLACDLALCASAVGLGKEPAQLTETERVERKRFTDEALATLRQAMARGWRNIEHFKKDEDLDALRGLPEFQQLLAELSR